MTSMNLTIYIDKKLLEPNPSTGLPDIGNLAFARKVGGVANVIFQSKTTAYFSEGNSFQWQQSYQIGANLTPPQPSTFMKATTGPKSIQAGQMCDWTNPVSGGPPIQYMPDAKLADQGFTDKYPAKTGMFGTKNEPSQWFNSIWCATSGSEYKCIYTDTTPPTPGLNYRAYLVENNYQVSWETQNFAPGVFASSWSDPFAFSMPGSSTNKYLSWGYPPSDPANPMAQPKWYDYGTSDPGKHDPSKAVGSSVVVSLMGLSGTSDLASGSAFKPVPVSMRLEWTGNTYTNSVRSDNARATFEYLKKSTSGWLNIHNVYIGNYLSADIGLRSDTSFGDYLPGETEADKIRFYLRALINNIAPRFAPNNLDWNYGLFIKDDESVETEEIVSFTDLFKLVWDSLPPGAIVAAATASATFLMGLMTTAWNTTHTNNIALEFEAPVTVGSGQATCKFKASGLSSDQYNQAINLFRPIVTQEHNRQVPVPGNPGLPLPDNVQMGAANAPVEEILGKKLLEAPPQGRPALSNGHDENEKNGTQSPQQSQQQPQPQLQQQQFPYHGGFQPKQDYYNQLAIAAQ